MSDYKQELIKMLQRQIEHEVCVLESDNTLPVEIEQTLPVVLMRNTDDPHYTQVFRTPEEVDNLIQELETAKNRCWPKS